MGAPFQRERSFGLSVGSVLVLISGLLLWRGRLYSAEILGVIGLVLLVSGYVRPSLLKWPSALWWRLAMILGYINARFILTVVFVMIFTPMGLIWRLIGRDPLALSRRRWPGWVPHPARYRSRNHYTRMY